MTTDLAPAAPSPARSADDGPVAAAACADVVATGVAPPEMSVADLPRERKNLYNWQRKSQVLIKTL